jgi:hypothetical protein
MNNSSEDRFFVFRWINSKIKFRKLLGKNNKLNIKLGEILKLLNKYCKEIIDYFDKNIFII